jgi:hypothetical protein
MNTEEHLEHIEHSQHASLNPFDKRVAMTMAIIAAVLACVTMLSHRAHNETLRLQGEAIRLQSQANTIQTQAADQWGFYQAKNIRYHEYKSYLNLSGFMAKEPGKESTCKKAEDEWQAQVQKYDMELPKLKEEAEAMDAEAKKLKLESDELIKKSEEQHHKGDRFDQSELAVEFGLVLCSIAVLTKQSTFWHIGIVGGIVGVVIALTAFLMH